jgi:hypothetical protein
MKEVIMLLAELVNTAHDILLNISNLLGLNMTDKDLHLWVLGMIGIVSFAFVQIIFKYLAKWSITAISFIYTFTVMVVLVFAIEIQQKITGRGNMEFADAVIGLWGFIIFFSIYLSIRLLLYGLKKLLRYFQNKRKRPIIGNGRFRSK